MLWEHEMEPHFEKHTGAVTQTASTRSSLLPLEDVCLLT